MPDRGRLCFVFLEMTLNELFLLRKKYRLSHGTFVEKLAMLWWEFHVKLQNNSSAWRLYHPEFSIHLPTIFFLQYM